MNNLVTLVLNASYEPVNVINANRAVVLILNGKAEAILDTERLCGSGSGGTTLMFPSVVRLKTMRNIPRVRQVPLSRRALFQRDRQTCQYCGDKPTSLEVEHVIPRSKGGKNNWLNVVAACRNCNAHKRDRTPAEAGMILLQKPYAPTRMAMIAARGHDEWKPFLQFMEQEEREAQK